MQISTFTEKKENAIVDLTIEVAADDVSLEYNKIYNNYFKNLKLPGFRPGKVPVDIIEKKYKSTINAKVMESIIPAAYKEALKTHNITAITQPQIKVIEIDKGKPLKFTARIETYPVITIGEYKKITVHKNIYIISKENIDEQLKLLQAQYIQLTTKENQTAEVGDIITVDIEYFTSDGSNQKLENYRFELSEQSLLPEMIQQIVGMKKNEQKKIEIVYPANYIKKNLAGKKVKILLTLKEVNKKIISQIDDEFAKDVGEYKNLSELKKDIEKQLKILAENRSKNEVEEEIIKQIITKSKFDIPLSLIEKEVNHSLMEYNSLLQSRTNVTLDEYLERGLLDSERLRKIFVESATYQIKKKMILEEVARIENIKPTDEELNKELERIALENKMDKAELRKQLEASDKIKDVIYLLTLQKSLKFLYDNAHIKKGKKINFSLGG